MNGYKGLRIPDYNSFAATNRSCCLSVDCEVHRKIDREKELNAMKCRACLFGEENEIVFQEWDKAGRPVEELPVESYDIFAIDPDYDEDEDV